MAVPEQPTAEREEMAAETTERQRKAPFGAKRKAAKAAQRERKAALAKERKTAKVPMRASRRDKASTEQRGRNLTRRPGTAKSDPTDARATAAARTTRAAFRAQAMTMATLGLLAAAAAITTQVMTDDKQQLEPLTIRAGELSVQAPVGWEQTKRTKGRFGLLSGSLAAAPAGRLDIALTAGVIGELAATERALRQLRPQSTEASRARLGPLEASRYSGLRPRPGVTGTAYVLHTTGPSILIMCEAPAAGGRGALRACAKAASTVRVRGERPVSLAVEQRRRAAVRAALADLLTERLRARRRIAAAPLADEQAAATRELQVSYEEAWGRVLGIDMPDTEAADVLAALGETAAAYGALATAISGGDERGYDEARAAVDQAEKSVWSETDEFAG